MAIEVRTIRDDELETFFATGSIGFGTHPEPGEVEGRRATFDMERTYAAYEPPAAGAPGQMVATTTSYDLKFTLPGGAVQPVAAVAWVSVLPTHTRRGIAREMLTRQLRDTRERGELFAALWASEGAIYGRYGYGAATFITAVRVNSSKAQLVDAPDTVRGSVRFVTRDEERQLVPGIYSQFAQAQPGALHRVDAWWEWVLSRPDEDRNRFTVVSYNANGDASGYCTYTVKGDWGAPTPAGVVRVVELIAVDQEAYGRLWQHLLTVDLMAEVRAGNLPLDMPLPWMLHEPRAVDIAEVRDALWLRLIDVPRCLEARSYAGEGELVLAVRDALLPHNEGTYLLQAGRGGAQCDVTTHDAQLELDVRDLASLYLGGVTATTLVRAGRMSELSPGAAARADSLFACSPQAWNPHSF